MHTPTLFRDRERSAQIILGGVIPCAIGVLAGIGGFLAGFEHLDGWGGADRGLVGGTLYGISLLVAHGLAGTHAEVSLGSFPPLLAVVTAIIGMLLGAAGGRVARTMRERTTREPVRHLAGE